jgi:cation transport regulator ChaB
VTIIAVASVLPWPNRSGLSKETYNMVKETFNMAKETYNMAKETYNMAKETYNMAKETYICRRLCAAMAEQVRIRWIRFWV